MTLPTSSPTARADNVVDYWRALLQATGRTSFRKHDCDTTLWELRIVCLMRWPPVLGRLNPPLEAIVPHRRGYGT